MSHERDHAETVGLQALAWLAANEDLLPVFLSASGADGTALRTGARDPAFLGAVLDFILQDDAWVVGFCDVAGLGYDAPATARMRLPGGGAVHWT
jgi:hypothetical protein